MNISIKIPALVVAFVLLALHGCNEQSNTNNDNNDATGKVPGKYREGTDYFLFERVRVFDKVGFSQPQEAFSVLLPKGWQHSDEVIWNAPGTMCAGTYKKFKATSADNAYSLQMYPDVLYIWGSNQQMMQFNQNNNPSSSTCAYRQPIDAEIYLRTIFAKEELGNAEVVSVTPNKFVVEQMAATNAENTAELQQYGAGDINFDQSAINAVVKWPDGTEGMVVLGITIMETIIPNIYNGSYEKSYTTQVSKRTVFKYPAKETEQAKNQFSLIMGSFRSNPAWNDAVRGFWKAVRQRKHVEHIGKIRMIDEQTRRMGEQAIAKGNARLSEMDNQMRNWEATQSSQDRMHTNFIKTIREVENFKDASGTYELSSGYSHAWSRGDGNSFILTNDPNLDPAFIFKDQNWKEMQKSDN